MNQNSKRVAAPAIGLIAPVLVVLARIESGSVTPDPLPTHWSTGGAVNGTMGAAAYFGWALAISLLLALGAGALTYQRRSPDAGRLVVALLVASSWLVSGVYLLSILLARHAATAQQVKLPWYALVLTIAVPAIVGVAIWSLLPAPSTAAQPLPHSAISLGRTERVTWISHAHSVPSRIAAIALTVGAAVLVFFSVLPAVIVFVIGVLFAGTSEIAVRVDDDGLHTMWGPFGWPRQVLHLDAIAGATAQHISPMRWGGWGFRITSRGTAATIRSGPGIVVQRTNGSTFVVTVDDAALGADVLNALLVRGGA